MLLLSHSPVLANLLGNSDNIKMLNFKLVTQLFQRPQVLTKDRRIAAGRLHELLSMLETPLLLSFFAPKTGREKAAS
ncbi:MAG: hypothetical protein JXR29_09470 [Methylothermaceae bacterium]|nr:hypothetical protein [Methylothermaceae bacterium]